MADASKRPIIVIKKKISGGGHHGGAWKVAYADFVTAMMSLFIVLWLLNSTPQVKKAVAGYFNDPKGSGKEVGSAALGSGDAVSIDTTNVAKLKEEIEKAILKQKDLDKLSKQVELTLTSEGLKIDLIEDQGGTFFESGSPRLSESGVKLMTMLASQVKDLPNHLLLEGHTDAQPYAGANGYTNWELSSDRANAARRSLQEGGVASEQISQVRGYADQMLRVPSNPLDPSNRRISLIVEWIGAPNPKAPLTVPGAALASGTAPATGTAPAPAGTAEPAAAKRSAGEPEAATSPGAQTAPPKEPAAPVTAPPVPTPAPAVTPAKAPPPAAKPTLIARIKSMLPGNKTAAKKK